MIFAAETPSNWMSIAGWKPWTPCLMMEGLGPAT